MKVNKDLIELIDAKLSILLENMSYDQYVEFIESNKTIKTYDNVMAYSEIGIIPKTIPNYFTKQELSKVLSIVNKKIESLGLH